MNCPCCKEGLWAVSGNTVREVRREDIAGEGIFPCRNCDMVFTADDLYRHYHDIGAVDCEGKKNGT